MANYVIKLDLLKLKGASVRDLQGRTETKRCVIIPVDDDNGIYVGEKGCYLNLTAIEMQTPRYSDTHFLKVSHDREVYERMSEEERIKQPIVGGLHELRKKQLQEVAKDEDNMVVGGDLPF